VCLTFLIIIISLICAMHDEKMAELGYEEGVVQGVQETVWVKVKD
jgi:hypothetical protein